MTLRAQEVIGVKRALDLPQDVRGDKVQEIVPKPLKAQKRRDAMGASFQHGGARVVEVEALMLRESKERTSFLQLFSQPANVTLEALTP